MQQNLNTSNPEHIIFSYEELQFAALGGIRLDGLDRLRVTVKIEFKQTAIRHNLDLYNDSQVEKLIRKCAERFEVGTVYIPVPAKLHFVGNCQFRRNAQFIVGY